MGEKRLSNITKTSVQFSWVAQLCLTLDPWTAACQVSLSPVPRVYSNTFPLNQGCHPTISPSVIPFSSRLQSYQSVLHIRWPKYGNFSFSISPSDEYSGLISFRMDWLDLLAVQGTLQSLLQYHSSKASILWCSGFFMVQLSHLYMTTGKTIALTRWAFIGKVMSL